MLSLEDPRWTQLAAGYRLPFDPRPLLARLETESDPGPVWRELWDELHHQGDVGEASYAAVPHIVRIYRHRGAIDYNAYAIVAIIELARDRGKNPHLPDWLKGGYLDAIKSLAEAGVSDLPRATDHDTSRAILSILAIEKGLREHGRLLINYSESELTDLGIEI
jgi:hypothetical protein